MIQRIQSLYLLLTAGVMVLLAFIPMATFMAGSEELQITLRGIGSPDDPGNYIVPAWGMTILWGLATLFPFVLIFLYRHRLLQLRLCIVEIVLLAGMQAYVGFYVFNAKSVLKAFDISSMSYSPVDMMPIVGIILMVMAIRGIIRDQTLIRSLDRIR